jgi:hypothetical protein
LQVEHGLSVGRQLARGALIGLVMAGFITLSWLTTSAMLANGSYWSDEGIRYRAATLMFNYIDLGAVRRGLGGTLLRLTGLHPLFGLAVFHLLSSVFAAAVFCALIWQRSVRPLDRVLWVTGAAALFLLWSSDAGRTDAVVAASFSGSPSTRSPWSTASRSDSLFGLTAAGVDRPARHPLPRAWRGTGPWAFCSAHG